MLARAFLQEDVGAYFGLLGDANMYWGTRVLEAGAPFYFVRHEHSAVNAAAAFCRVTGRIAVATTTCGPGLTQVTTALTIAARARIPMVVFAGEAAVGRSFYNQGIDQAPFVVATGAAYRPVHAPGLMPVAVRDAFLQARRESRPVVLGMPMDLQAMPWSGDDTLPRPSHEVMPRLSPMPPNPADVDHAAKLVDASSRIIVMAGRGAVAAGAGEACRTLAEACGGLLAESLPVRGLFKDDPFSLGIAGGLARPELRELFGEADLVIAVGCSLGHHNADGGTLWPNAQILHVDIDPKSVNEGRVAAEAHLRADARLGVEALRAAITARASTWRLPEIAERLHDARSPGRYATGHTTRGHDPRGVVAALDQFVPDDWFFVNTSGHVSAFTSHMPSRRHDRFLTIRDFGAIGNGTSFALGAAAANPGRPVVLLDGDGSFLMHLQELETIRRHGLRVLAVVLNDGAYGSEIHKLRAKGMSDAGATFGRTDFATLARGFGLQGKRVDDLAALPELIRAFAAAEGGAVWDLPIDDSVTSPRMRQMASRGS